MTRVVGRHFYIAQRQQYHTGNMLSNPSLRSRLCQLDDAPPCNEAAATAPVRAVSQEDHSTCAANLACAREVANRSGGVTDIKRLITCTCLHIVPVKGCFIAARTNEQFSFYDLLLACLMPERMPAELVEKVCANIGASCLASHS